MARKQLIDIQYNEAFKQVRNKLRNYATKDVVLNCITRLNAPDANSIQNMRMQPPWRLLLLLKWSFIFGEFDS